jgi:hypothetical protein
MQRKGYFGKSQEHSLCARGIKITARGYPDKIIHVGGAGNQLASQIIQTEYQIKLLKNTMTTPQQIGFPDGFNKEQTINMLNINKQNDIYNLKEVLKNQSIKTGTYNPNAKQNYSIKRPDGTILNI